MLLKNNYDIIKRQIRIGWHRVHLKIVEIAKLRDVEGLDYAMLWLKKKKEEERVWGLFKL